jgi:CheY-like chemotaxis protein
MRAIFSSYEVVLVGDPDPDDVFFLKRTLHLAGAKCQVQAVNTGPEIIRYLEGTGKYADRDFYPFPGIVFLENYMPLLSGIEVLKRIRHFTTFVPFVLFVEEQDFRLCEEASELGVALCLSKPFQIEHLHRIREQLEHA